MTLISQSLVTFPGSSSSGASDLLRSSRNGVSSVPLKALTTAPMGMRRKTFIVSAKLGRRKKKQHDYPWPQWPQDPDPNVKGGVLRHLSPFKPLKEKPKPIILPFEKRLNKLREGIDEIHEIAKKTNIDFTKQIIASEFKYWRAVKDAYDNLEPIQRVQIARHPHRPTCLDHIFNITDKFVELHGDRAGYDDPAIVTGIGTINGRRFMFIGHQKGRTTQESIKRNFGMPTPHGYRKALRMMRYADHHGFPIVTFVDTPGAFADLKSERLNQGEAIAFNLMTMFGLKVPIVSIVMGEGGSGGALAIACANKLLMLEHAVFFVASPEAAAAIIYKSAKASGKAAAKLKITAQELCKLQIADGIIPEPLGGAHKDPEWTSEQIKRAILDSMDELELMGTEELLQHRMHKFRKIGGYTEGIPIDPIKKRNMKMSDKPKPATNSIDALEAELEKLRENILQGKASSSDSRFKERVDELNREMLQVIDDVIESSPDLKQKTEMLKSELSKIKESPNQESKNKIDALQRQLKQGVEKVLSTSAIKEKYEKLQAELLEASEGLNGSLPQGAQVEVPSKLVVN